MPYWEIVTRSFAIAWRRKYLWLLALFSGEGGGTSFNYSQSSPSNGGTGNLPDFGSVPRQVGDWLNQNLGLVLVIAVVAVLVWIALFVLAAVCEGAVVRASAEHDAERPFGLGLAWQCGVATMGAMVRFRLLLIALGLPAFIVVAALVAGLVLAILGHNTGVAVTLGVLAVLIFLGAFVYVIYLSFLDRLGTRAIVLELLGARAALVRGHRLLAKRLGRVLLVWLLSIATSIVVGIGSAIVLAILILPAVFIGIAVYSGGSPLFWLLIVVGLLILVPLVLLLAGFLAAQSSTYWTLAFRRMEIDRAPNYGYQQPQAPSPGPAV